MSRLDPPTSISRSPSRAFRVASFSLSLLHEGFWAVADSDSDSDSDGDGHAPAQAQPHERAVIGLVEDGSPRGLRSESPEEARTRRRLRTAAP